MDVLLQEQGSGGQVVIRNNDIVMVFGFENEPYLASFSSDWLFNDLLLTGDQQFTGQTEKVLRTVVLNSAGRILVENAIKDDLKYLQNNVPGTTVDVVAMIAARNRIDAEISFNGQTFYLNYHPDTSFLNYQLK